MKQRSNTYFPLCPYCKTNERVCESGKEHICERCGAKTHNGNWSKHCETCNKKVDTLVGLFVPHLCKECLDKIVDRERKNGNICLLCRQPRSLCCC